MRAGGLVIGWGSNAYGELGNGSTASESDTVEVDHLTEVKQLAAGYYHSLGIYTTRTAVR